jgi:hypothetical protein
MYLVLGNNVYSYDANSLVRATESLPRSVEVLAAILVGEHPRYLFVPSASQPEIVEQIKHLYTQLLWFLAKVAAIIILGVGLLLSAWRHLRTRKPRASAAV